MLASDVDKYDTDIYEWYWDSSEDDFRLKLNNPKYKAFRILNTDHIVDNSELEANINHVISILRDYPVDKPRRVLCYYDKVSKLENNSAYSKIIEKLDKAINCLEKQCNFNSKRVYCK